MNKFKCLRDRVLILISSAAFLFLCNLSNNFNTLSGIQELPSVQPSAFVK